MIARVAHNNASIAIDGGSIRVAELAVAAALGADGSNMRAVTVPQHLNAMIVLVSHKNVPGAVKGDAQGAIKLAVA